MDKDFDLENNNIDESQENEEKNKKKPILLLVLYSLSLLIFILSGTFTLSTILKDRQTNLNNIQVGEVRMDLINNDSTNIKLVDAYPMDDEEAKELKPFEFRVTNNGTLAVNYRLRLLDVDRKDVNIDLPSKRLDNDKISYSLVDKSTNEIVKTGTIEDLDDQILITEKLQPRYSKEFELRLWVNKTAGKESQNRYYIGNISLEIDEILE